LLRFPATVKRFLAGDARWEGQTLGATHGTTGQEGKGAPGAPGRVNCVAAHPITAAREVRRKQVFGCVTSAGPKRSRSSVRRSMRGVVPACPSFLTKDPGSVITVSDMGQVAAGKTTSGKNESNGVEIDPRIMALPWRTVARVVAAGLPTGTATCTVYPPTWKARLEAPAILGPPRDEFSDLREMATSQGNGPFQQVHGHYQNPNPRSLILAPIYSPVVAQVPSRR